MDGIKEVFASAHGVIGVALIIAATTLTALGVLSVDDWKSYTEVIFIGTAGAHAAISVGDSIASRGDQVIDHPSIQGLLASLAANMDRQTHAPASAPAPEATETV